MAAIAGAAMAQKNPRKTPERVKVVAFDGMEDDEAMAAIARATPRFLACPLQVKQQQPPLVTRLQIQGQYGSKTQPASREEKRKDETQMSRTATATATAKSVRQSKCEEEPNGRQEQRERGIPLLYLQLLSLCLSLSQ